jgi:hypothetical protein
MLLYSAKGKFPEDFYEQDYINKIPWNKRHFLAKEMHEKGIKNNLNFFLQSLLREKLS